MCDTFSFLGDGHGNYKYLDWEYRKTQLDENCDSHTNILTVHKVPAKLHHLWSKYEYNPLTRKFTVDEGVDGHDHESAEAWANTLDFKRIIEPLIIKPIVHPFKVHRHKVTDKDIADLQLWGSVVASVGASVRDSVWDSVWDSVGASVWDSVGASVRDSVGASVRDSVWDSVWDSVGASVRDSVWDSVWDSVGGSVWDSVGAYISSFFDIQYYYDFSPCVRLWERGFVPSFDGTTWRLHAGKTAAIVYKIGKESL
jgi:hypothetical protein